jgi:hypothetical protein
MAPQHPFNPATWFQRVAWVGIIANVALAIPTLLAPERMLAMASLPPATPLLWTRFSALLLILLSAFYTPAAIDCYRYVVVAWLAVMSRLVGVIFYSLQPPAYRLFGLFDLVFLVPEAILLVLALKARPLAASSESRVYR